MTKKQIQQLSLGVAVFGVIVAIVGILMNQKSNISTKGDGSDVIQTGDNSSIESKKYIAEHITINSPIVEENAIDTDKIFLGTQYAYVYENYKNSSQEDSFRIIDTPLPWNIDSDNDLWLAVYNKNIKNLKEVALHIYFLKGIIVDKSKTPWQDVLPNRKYTFHFNENIDNGRYLGITSLKAKFPMKKSYDIGYAITVEDMPFWTPEPSSNKLQEKPLDATLVNKEVIV